jgi:hypothetical protein
MIKLERLGWHESRPFFWAVGLSFLVVAAVVAYPMLRRRPAYEGAIALDRHHGLQDRLTNALYFSSLPSVERTELMELAIEDGCAHAKGLSPRKAAPFRFPPMVLLPVWLGLVLFVLGLVEIRLVHTVAEAKTIDAVALSTDDIDYFRKSLEEIDGRKREPEIQQAIDKFNQLVEDIANERLDRTEVFRRMEALNQELQAGTAADKKALEEGLDRIAQELRKSDLTKQVAEALNNRKLEEAEKQLKDLAQKLREKPKALTQAQREQLKRALEEAAKRNEERLKELENRRDELQKEMDRLLKMKDERPDGGTDEQEERLLKRKQRKLEQLNRQIEEQQRANRQLSRLDRELAEAAANLARDLGLSADDLERGAEDLNRMAREQMTDQEKEELRQRIQQMRELLRQQGRGGQPRMVRLTRFSQRARGQSGQQGQPGQQGQQGGQGQQGQQGGQGQQGQQGGQGQGEEVWVVGPNGEKMLVMKSSGGSGMGSQSGQSGGSPGGQGDQPGGNSWGTGHDPNLTGKATNPKMGTQDVTASGLDTGQGPSRAEVILGAADQGFVMDGYQKVFAEYETVAEKTIEKEGIPPGYRFYVQRYFQLIRPRE